MQSKLLCFCRDTNSPISVLTGLEYWLDNLMCNVPEIAMCYHLGGFVQVWYLTSRRFRQVLKIWLIPQRLLLKFNLPDSDKASKTETLDLCQLPRPPFEIHKMINLPASVKISYFHLPHQAKKNDKLKKVIFELPHGILDCDFNSLHAWTAFFTFSNTNL